ncbi:serine hydrolase [Tenggerimyces flavus]|uniref:Serine hydrolase n=1 Tax=Tenggerimyces flavus TaxID=1708749 RepID=A0ABV7YG45_9ACTN|nr:serine hydrolase [Tenggerimyces flavus]MBM7784101.1 CubicO group peptidase (beta-lactamase class C family) [Tenggerimyces flavus]
MWKRIVVGAAVLATLGVTGGVASAAPPDVTDPEQVKAFLDERVSELLADERIPGAAVSVVARGRPVAAEGYGLANVETKQKVEPDKTLFPIDSVSKLFTATAVMQLVEQGKVDLHTDVNRYLTGTKVSVPNTFEGKPITLAALLTHSAGFEELNAGTFAGTDDDHPDFDTYLKEHQPKRVRPPGILPAYSNYGIALAGFVVQTQSKQTFEQYVQQHILEPLGMKHTTFDQPPSPDLKRNLATGHRPDGDHNRPVDDGYDILAPAGAAVATVTDLSEFMLAHLGVGQDRILNQVTANEMHSKQFTPDERLPGMAYGFYEGDVSGERTLQHGGDGAGTHGLLTLIPERQAGIYIVVNGDGTGVGGTAVVERLAHEFVRHFYPKPAQAPIVKPANRSEQVEGTYRYGRISDTDISRGFAIMETTVTVDAQQDGTLTTTGRMSVDPTRTDVTWLPVDDRLYQEKGGAGKLAFTQASNGETVMSLGEDPTVGWTKLRWYEQPGLHLAVIVGSLLVLLTMLAWPVIALVRRGTRPGRAARLVAGAMLLVLTAFLGGLAYYLSNIDTFIDQLLAGSTTLNALLTLPLVAAVLGIAVIVNAARAWRKGWWSIAGRVQYSAIALAVLGFFTIAYEYNFLAWPW